MIMGFSKAVFFIMIASQTALWAGGNGSKLSFTLKGNYTSSSRLYLSPKASDETVRNSSYALDHIYSPALEVKYLLSEQLSLGLNIEYIKKTEKGIFVNVIEDRSVVSVEIEDGYGIVPVELSLYYHLPFSSDEWRLSIYGGGAFYIGSHIRKLGDLEVENLKRKLAYGIQVGVLCDYVINRFLAVSGELKFRDPEVSLTTSYKEQTVHYGSRTLIMGQNSFDSKINIDGITYSLGIKISI
jgi:hypothetical protein